MGLFDRIKGVVSSNQWPGSATWIPADRVVPPPQPPPPPFVADGTYLRWFLSEARLEKSRSWFTDWHPAIHAATARSFGSTVDEHMSVIAPGAIPGFEGTAAASVTFDKPLTPLLPFPGGTVAVNIGLVAIKGDNSVRTLIDVLGSFGGLVASSTLTAGLDVAGKVVDGFEKLLGLDNNNGTLAYDGTLGLSGGGAAVTLAPGYLAVLDDPVPAHLSLWVQDGGLLAWDGQGESLKPPCNYLLLRLESRTTRDEWRYLDDIEEPLLAALQATDGEIRRVNFQRAIIAAHTSPDLHQADRIRIASTLKDMRDQPAGHGATAGAISNLADVAALTTLTVEDALLHRPGLSTLLA